MNFFGPSLNIGFIVLILLGILILVVPNILETLIAIIFIITGVSGLLSGFGRRRIF
ncbi:MAG: DUF3096 domain-containing protein [Nanoarchaeota archaeon]|nr:DUF3096 domain-containing protein [Nanoarchaeota archaeon]MBU1269079.1 DUF3096 domain-containing protein [Nanoarchaeota archaeon]MBU1604732.1 DUF3096 domain-containing protein [Nanoarchaeota archaeon]MBU2442984.1 DUF3096 domain-containing protein [Nanoarchaeota archaeon]